MPKIKLNAITLIVSLTVVFSAFMVVKGIACQPTISAHERKEQEILEEMAYVDQKSQKIDEDRNNKDTDEGKEQIARKQLGMVKNGEVLYIDISGRE